jgi:hypothetical protein
MKIGLFGYPGERLALVKAMQSELLRLGAKEVICLGGLVFGGRTSQENPDPPATVLRWLRSQEIPTLANDSDRQIAGWRLQGLANTTGYIRRNIRQLLGALTIEEAQWINSRPVHIVKGEALCCSDVLTVDSRYPVPLSRHNAEKLFKVMKERMAFFPSANGPELIARKQEDGAIESAPFQDIDEELDSPRTATVIGGIIGYSSTAAAVSWGALVDTTARHVTLVCLDARTGKSIPDRGRLLAVRSAGHWQDEKK